MSPRALLTLALMAAAAYALFAYDAQLDASVRADRQGAGVPGLLVDDAEREALQIAALRVIAGDDEHVFARSGGIWRCLSWRGALASESAISAVIDMLFAAKGPRRDVEPARLPAYGFASDDTLRLQLHGPDMSIDPDKDVRFELELGHALPELGGGFARRPQGSVRVLDVDLRAPLTPRDGRPPLLDPTLFGRAMLPPGVRLSNVLVEAPGRPPLRLLERPSGASEEDLRRGASTWVHVIVAGDDEPQPTAGMLAGSFLYFLVSVPWVDMLTAEEVDAAGFETPIARVLVERSDDVGMGLLLGRADATGRVPVYNTATRTAAWIRAEAAAAMQPVPADLLPGAVRNLWDPWLQP